MELAALTDNDLKLQEQKVLETAAPATTSDPLPRRFERLIEKPRYARCAEIPSRCAAVTTAMTGCPAANPAAR